ncbi:MAG: UDP-N-acetylenolpyruvoylglucosamine reductase, partial [Candidatus Doudnabacteria bacterium RIFCSPHIGHO2_01_FULL_49_9]
MQIKKNFLLKRFTTMAVGGPAKFFVVAKSEKDLLSALQIAKIKRLPWYVVGEGSNLIPSDSGFAGVIIQIQYSIFHIQGNVVTVGAGYNLLKFINQLNRRGLAGFEKMAGIPGSVGGAIYGSAGAYGQELKDRLVTVRIYDGRGFRTLAEGQWRFGYRGSIFKQRKDWIITEATFRLEKGDAKKLAKISRDTIKRRAIKYPPGLKCSGSYFKNLLVRDIQVPAELKTAVMFGKLPVGVLLERVGAKGMRQGGMAVASHHANLLYNAGRGRASDLKKLSTRL